jgi:hypothetical protein
MDRINDSLKENCFFYCLNQKIVQQLDYYFFYIGFFYSFGFYLTKFYYVLFNYGFYYITYFLTIDFFRGY